MNQIALTGTLEAIGSKMDRNGNRYWALRYTDHITGKVVCGTVSGGESNVNSMRLYWGNPAGWDGSIRCVTVDMGIRDFQRLTKAWTYAGCTGEEIAAYVRKQLTD